MAMMKDLSRFTYYSWIESQHLRAIGWLDATSDFDIGSVPDEFLDRLALLIHDPWVPPFASLGWHDCELCAKSTSSITSIGNVEVSSRSSREIFVPWNGQIFICPESIGHYVACHRYVPPKEFVNAVCKCPPVRSMEFKKLFLESGGGVLLKAPGR